MKKILSVLVLLTMISGISYAEDTRAILVTHLLNELPAGWEINFAEPADYDTYEVEIYNPNLPFGQANALNSLISVGRDNGPIYDPTMYHYNDLEGYMETLLRRQDPKVLKGFTEYRKKSGLVDYDIESVAKVTEAAKRRLLREDK